MEKVSFPRIMLSAVSSNSGKTMITCGILQALVNRNIKPAAFKCGPDYIDPMFHGKVLGVSSRNLDTFFTADETTRYLLSKEVNTADIGILEGVMGYYDGITGMTTDASSYDLSRVSKTPTVLIVNTKGMSLSIIPLLQGFVRYKEDSNVKGVILNRMSPMIYDKIKEAIEEQVGIKVLGYVPPAPEFAVESRHLGLVTPDEIKDIKDRINGLAGLVEKYVDLDGLIELAKTAEDLEFTKPEFPHLPEGKKPRIGLARDEAFCFNYRDNLELMESMGAELVYFSPLRDAHLPENLDGLILYGGYPEVYAKQLSENTTMIEEIKSLINFGKPYLAECGGFMYLHESMEDMDGVEFPMVGVIEGKAFKTGSLKRFGYITVNSQVEDVLGLKDVEIRAHEFHYFDSTNNGADFKAQKPKSNRGWECIHADNRSISGFPHLYYHSNVNLIYAFLEKCSLNNTQEEE